MPPPPRKLPSDSSLYGLSNPEVIPLLAPPPPPLPYDGFYGVNRLGVEDESGGKRYPFPPTPPPAGSQSFYGLAPPHERPSDTPPPSSFSRIVAAEWLDYTRVKCVSPPWPTPDGHWVGRVAATRHCRVTVTNDGDQYDDMAAVGGMDLQSSPSLIR